MRRCVFILTLCLIGLGASAATLEHLSLDEMAQRSTAIVRARAISSSTSLIGSTIYTHTRFQVLERWKGLEGAQVEVVEPGGTVGQLTQTYSGVPRFTPGQELVMFLWTGPSGRTQVIGLSQGVFGVAKSAAGEDEVSREASGDVVLAPVTGEQIRDEALRMPLRTLLSRIRAAMDRSRQR